MKIYFASLCLLLLFSFSVFSQTAEVISENANLRGTPSTKGKIVDVLQLGSNLEVIKQSGPWFLVQATDYVGWVHGDTIRLTSFSAEPTPSYSPSPRNQGTPQISSPSRAYIRGPRGGCYYINSNGNKTYVSRSLCN